MRKFAIYQLPEGNPKIRDMYFMGKDEIEEISDQYELVGLVNAETFSEVFEIGNIDFDKIEIVGDMHSVSVGDILEDLSTGIAVVVERIGFSKIDMKEEK